MCPAGWPACDCDYCQAAFQQGVSDSCADLAALFLAGAGTTRDEEKAVAVYQYGCSMGNVNAMYYYGLYLRKHVRLPACLLLLYHTIPYHTIPFQLLNAASVVVRRA